MFKAFTWLLAGAILASFVWYFWLVGELKNETTALVTQLANTEASDIQIAVCQETQRVMIASCLAAELSALEVNDENMRCHLTEQADRNYQLLVALQTEESEVIDGVAQRYQNLAPLSQPCLP